jgi:hypothetical protein
MAIPFSNENLTLAQMTSFVAQLSYLEIGQDPNDDISTDLVYGFIKEGFQKIYNLSTRWPYYQATYSFSTIANQRGYSTFARSLPSAQVSSITDLNQVISVVNNTNAGNALIYLDQFKCESLWVGTQDTTGIPAYFSIWANQVNLWPKPDQVYNISIRGFRRPSLTWLSDANTAIDISPDMQLALTNYVLARIFQFQEDPEMAAVYNRNFEQEVAIIQGNLTAPNNNQPLIMSGGLQLTAYDYWWADYPGIQVLPGTPNPLAIMY